MCYAEEAFKNSSPSGNPEVAFAFTGFLLGGGFLIARNSKEVKL
jgi:hypothetical protein